MTPRKKQTTKSYINYLHYVVIAVVVVLALHATAQPQQEREDDTINLLMVGDSYIRNNDLNGMLQALLSEYYDDISVSVSRRARNGAQLEGYIQQEDNFLLEDAILPTKSHFNWIILQEQSQLTGFWESYYHLFEPSLQAVIELDDQIQNYNKGNGSSSFMSDTVLFLTWGKKSGDSRNPTLYPDFLTMQNLINQGYYQYRDAITTKERPVKIAPVGLAFERIYLETLIELEQQLETEGATADIEDGLLNPAEDGTKFSNLYSDDYGNASVQGSYLAACVLYATLTGEDARHLEWAPDGMDDSLRDYLQSVAQVTVAEFVQHDDNADDGEDEKQQAGNTYVIIIHPPSDSYNSTDFIDQMQTVIVIFIFALFFVLAVLLLLFLTKRTKETRNHEKYQMKWQKHADNDAKMHLNNKNNSSAKHDRCNRDNSTVTCSRSSDSC